MSGDFEAEIKRDFLAEALLNLDEAESAFMELESSSDPKPLLDRIFRLAHNLKGGSRAVGFGGVAEFTHELENLVQKLRQDQVTLNPAVVTVLLRSNDRLIEMLTELKSNLGAVADNSELLAEISNCIAGGAVTTQFAPVAPVIPVAPVAPLAQFQPGPVVETALPAPALAPVQTAPVASTKREPEDEVVRVNVSRIEKLNDMAGELIVLQSVVQQQIDDSVSPSLAASIQQMSKLSKDVQELSMRLRMLPVKPLIQKLQRVVRDTAQALTKEVQFSVEGDQMEVDKSVLDRLADPLIHILRNAVDHGLEDTAARVKTGKAAAGVVRLSFLNEGNHLVVEVRDDGKGIDAELLRRKAAERGIIAADANLSEKQLIHLIFHPGFSTKAQTSEISGRGVGMDVVKTNVERIGGSVDIATRVGSGSTFRIKIPLSLAVIDGLVVTTGKKRYVVPLGQVQETLNLRSANVHERKAGVGTCLSLRGTIVPIVNLEDALAHRSTTGEIDGETAFVVIVGDQPIAIAVKEIVRSQQVVVKPLEHGIVSQAGWVGCCVLGDGLPTLIVSPVDLVEGQFSQRRVA